MKTFVAFAFLAAFSATPLLAAPATETFTQDGKTFYVTKTDMGSYTLLSGHDSAGREFEFRVADGRVSGRYDNDYMEFAAPTATKQIALR